MHTSYMFYRVSRQMGNDAAANNIIALAKRPLEIGRLSEDAIRHLVDSFYAKVRADPELGPIFERAIRRRLGTPPCDDARLLVVGNAH